MSDLISKKDLLTAMEISYGQLYRWKRERLIPEEWFIKQSAFTGQETFFPKAQILERVSLIKKLKDECSLDEMARILNMETSSLITSENVSAIAEIDPEPIAVLREVCPAERYHLVQIAFLAQVSKCATELHLSSAQLRDLCRVALPVVTARKDASLTYTVFKVGDGFHMAFSKSSEPLEFDESAKLVASFVLTETAHDLQTTYSSLFTL